MKLFGYRNVAYYPGPRPEGYAVWFRSRQRRDKVLAWLRDTATRNGLSADASVAGIYPVTARESILSDDERDELAAEGCVRKA